MSADLVKVDVCGEQIDACRDGETIWISVRRICDVLGLASNGQIVKLKGKPWATDKMIVSVADDGKSREIYCLSLKSLPMWLATIEPSRSTSPHLKTLLARFQREAADVLYSHFFTRTTTAQPMPYELAHVAELTALVAKLAGDVTDLRARITNGAAFIHGIVSPMVGNGIKRRLHLMGQQLAACKASKNVASGRQRQTQHLRAVLGWSGRWNSLPLAKEADAIRELESMERATNMIANALSAGRQLSLAVDNRRTTFG